MAGVTQLQIYNEALLLCEERILATVTENRKPRLVLDQVWNDGGVNACLEEALWTFATRTTAMTPNPNIQPAWGYINAFQLPADYIRTAALSSEPYFNSEWSRVADEDGYLWADISPLYLKYTSKDANYGNDTTKWPETFKLFVYAHFAARIVKSITHDKSIQERVAEERKTTLISSRSKDAMNEPPQFFPRGTLTRARQGYQFGRPGRNGNGDY
jgi:hypothetical protein